MNSATESDSTPQTIYPRFRYRFAASGPFQRLKYPHPVLCGPRGTISVLPDHQHEGDCILPDPAFADEYPGGVKIEIAAEGRNVVGRTSGNHTMSSVSSTRGTGDEGRVLVDSTWHHGFNTNLFGLRAEDGVEYADFLAYFRNYSIWLAPKGAQRGIRRAGTLIALTIPSIVENTFTGPRWCQRAFGAMKSPRRTRSGPSPPNANRPRGS